MNSKNEMTLKNAEEVIERFGGIRPMSNKTEIPVTTIQGWKKRNSVPAARTQDIVKAAQENDIDLSDLLEGAAESSATTANAGTNTPKGSKKSDRKAVTIKETAAIGSASDKVSGKKDEANTLAEEKFEEKSEEKLEEKRAHDVAKTLADEPITLSENIKDENDAEKETKASYSAAPYAGFEKAGAQVSLEELEERLAKVEQKAVTKSAVISLVVVLLAAGAIAALLLPKAQKAEETLETNSAQIAEMRGQMDDMKEQGIGGFVGSMIPQEWKDQIGEYQMQAEALAEEAKIAKEQVGEALKRAEEISGDVLGQEAGSLQERVTKLEAHLSELGFNPNLTAFMGKMNAMEATGEGQEMLDRAVVELSNLYEGFNGTPETLNSYLNDVRQQSPALGETFEGVPGDDLKAAALLLTMEQFRGALKRDGQAFDEDLALMKKMVGAENNELSAALDKLAPQAQDGVLSVGGLSDELRGLAGEAVVSSLKGEDVNFNEKARARMNDLFSVEKDGELVTGTGTQATLAKTQNLMEAGQLNEAIATAEMLDGEAAQTIAPWLEKAKATAAAQDITKILDYNIDMQVSNQSPSEAVSNLTATVQQPGRMIHDPKSGYRIYLPEKSGFETDALAAPKGLKAE